LPSMKWRPAFGPRERFYLGGDESDIEEDDENNAIYGFGSSPDSWDSNIRRNESNKSFSTSKPESRKFSDVDNKHPTCFVMSSEEEDNNDDFKDSNFSNEVF